MGRQQVERGQRLYVASSADVIFEGSLLELDAASGKAKLDPIAELTLDPATRAWRRRPLPKGAARVEPLSAVHDDENEARHYARNGYASPLGDVTEWFHPTKRLWSSEPPATPAVREVADAAVAKPPASQQPVPTLQLAPGVRAKKTPAATPDEARAEAM
jgi:hypothetical protein